MRRIGMWVGVVVAIGLTSAACWAQDAPAKTEAAKETATAPAPPPASPSAPMPVNTVPKDYVIGSEDTVMVSVWNEEKLTATLPVRPDGKISLPLLNDVQASGFTPMQLADSITEKLKKFVADPRVTVVATQMNSQKVFMLGEVLHTGALPLLPNMTVLQALSTAGFSQFANQKKIYILRVEDGKQQKLPFNYKMVVKGEQMEQNILLRPGDTVVVP
jgi:polysaccharide export outer membrane protein